MSVNYLKLRFLRAVNNVQNFKMRNYSFQIMTVAAAVFWWNTVIVSTYFRTRWKSSFCNCYDNKETPNKTKKNPANKS